jgi:hypothetical protein
MTANPTNNLQDFIDSRIAKPIEFETVDDGCADRFLESLRPVERKIVEGALDAGGFIAGGCPRYVTETIDHMGGYDEIDANAYRQFGDCDLFFPNDDAYQTAFNDILGRRDRIQLSLKDDSQGRKESIDADQRGIFAVNVRASEIDQKGKTLPFQLIKCSFGDLPNTLARFDIFNSMIGFFRENGKMRTLRARGWLQNERSNTLNVLVWDSPLSFYRIQKYIQKYGYERIAHMGITHDQIMQDMARTMDALPFDPEPSRRRAYGWQHVRSDEEKIIFTQQNYALHIVNTLVSVGHNLPEEVVVFMLSLCMATGVINDMTARNILVKTNEMRRLWDPKVTKARVESWKESQRKMLAEKVLRKKRLAQGEDVYGLGMSHRIPLPGFKGQP